MRIIRNLAALAIACLMLAATAHAAGDAPIDPGRLSRIVKTLAAEDFEGRSPGTRGEWLTVGYLIGQFEALGLEPGGENGGWTQAVPMHRTQLLPASRYTVHKGNTTRELAAGTDIYLSTLHAKETIRIDAAPLVFVGYGVDAPERDWDDFKGVDLRGKVAVFLVNDPDFAAAPSEEVAGRFGARAMTYYGRWTYKFDEAARRGAAAAVLIHETAAAGYGWNVVTSPGGENFDTIRAATDTAPVLLQGWVQRDAARALLQEAGLELETLEREARSARFRPVELEGLAFSADVQARHERIDSQNVLARISGAAQPAETIMFGAHWDAFGMGPADAEGRRARAGAADDALGIAGVLEIARAFAAGPRPARSLVFAAWTAEERGLLGSATYAARPLYPVETTVANFTMDILQTAGPARDVVLIGAGQNTLEDTLARFAATQGRSITPDARPERGLFYRADHFPLARRGVPVLLLMGIGGGADLIEGGREAGNRWVEDFTRDCYHETCDRWSADWDLGGAAQDVELLYLMGRELANSRDWPEWKPGSEFAAVRAESAAARR